MRTELISIPTPTDPLDAAYYTPDRPSKGAVMYCHGNQMNFYVCAAGFLAPHVTSLGYVFMPFNRRGHDSVSTYNSRECVGGACQTGNVDEQRREAEALVAAGKPRQLMLIPAWWWVISVRTFLDRLTNAPETWKMPNISNARCCSFAVIKSRRKIIRQSGSKKTAVGHAT
jgi:hypothetical protein